MTEKRFCLQCDDGTELVHECRDMQVSIEEMSASITGVSGWHCPGCGECEFDAGEAHRYADTLQQLRKEVAQRRGEEMRLTRKRLHLSQKEAGNLFGGGTSAFSEYERGKTQPHKSTVLLLKLLGQHPERLQEIRRAE